MIFQHIRRGKPLTLLLWMGLLVFIFAPLPQARAQQPPPQQAVTAAAQTEPPSAPNPPAPQPKTAPSGTQHGDSTSPARTGAQPKNDRILGVVPNYSTVENRTPYQPLTVGGKFKITAEGAFDCAEFGIVAALAGFDQATNEDPTWGQGFKGYARRYGARFADQLSGNIFVGAVYPALLHEDPRYFRRGEGGFGRRAGYALSRVVITKRDSGSEGFNFSELLGNATAAGLSNAYHPRGERSASETIGTWVTQLGIDAAGNEAKEFWPDIKRILHWK
jgi:hypothetical protein